MKLSRVIRLAILGGLGIIIIALVILLVFIPSRSDLASNPTLTPTIRFVLPTNTRLPRPTSAPSVTPTPAPTQAPTIAATNTPTVAPSATATATLVPTLAVFATSSGPLQTATPPLGFSLLYITPMMTTGGTAQVTISTAPGAACTVTVYDPRGKIAQATGLESKKAGVDGICTWIWTVTRADAPGTGFVSINSNSMTQTFVYTHQ